MADPAHVDELGRGGDRFGAAHELTGLPEGGDPVRAPVRRAEAVAASTELVDMGRVGHYMFRSIPAWNAFAVSRSLAFAGAERLGSG